MEIPDWIPPSLIFMQEKNLHTFTGILHSCNRDCTFIDYPVKGIFSGTGKVIRHVIRKEADVKPVMGISKISLLSVPGVLFG